MVPGHARHAGTLHPAPRGLGLRAPVLETRRLVVRVRPLRRTVVGGPADRPVALLVGAPRGRARLPHATSRSTTAPGEAVDCAGVRARVGEAQVMRLRAPTPMSMRAVSRGAGACCCSPRPPTRKLRPVGKLKAHGEGVDACASPGRTARAARRATRSGARAARCSSSATAVVHRPHASSRRRATATRVRAVPRQALREGAARDGADAARRAGAPGADAAAAPAPGTAGSPAARRSAAARSSRTTTRGTRTSRRRRSTPRTTTSARSAR